MGKLKSYYDFAENDYKFFVEDYKNGRIANYMCAIAQNICERFLKHIIDVYDLNANKPEHNDILRVHNLQSLLDYIKRNIMDFSITRDEELNIKEANGYYFSARYPGDESITAEREDIDRCYNSVSVCRTVVDRYVSTKVNNTLPLLDAVKLLGGK